VILSKYPLVDSSGHIFTAGNQIDYYASKQARMTMREHETLRALTERECVCFVWNSRYSTQS
jgi:hypothetical protein